MGRVQEFIQKNVFIFFLYVLVAIGSTYPLVLYIGDSFPSDFGDSTQYLWNIWWFKFALLNGQNPFFSDYIYHPYGTGLIYNAFMPFRGLVSVPLQMLFGLVPAHNILIFISLSFSGFFMFLLAKKITNNIGAAFLAGAYFMLTPFLAGKIEAHQNLADIAFLPLLMLTLIKLSESPTILRLLSVCLCLIAIFLTDYYQFFYAIIIMICAFFFISKDKQYRKYVIFSFGCSLLFLSPLVAIFMWDYLHYQFAVLREAEKLSLDPVFLFRPSVRIWFYRMILPVGPILHKRFGDEVFLGLFPTAIILSQIYFLKKYKILKFLILLFGVCFLFALGPQLKLNNVIFDFISLPYALILQIPIVQNIRAPIRFIIPMLVVLSVLFAMSYTRITEKISLRSQRILFGVFFMLIALEFLSVPIRLEKPSISPFFYSLQQDAEDFAVWIMPLEFWEDQTRGSLAQTVHEKRVLGGFVSRLSERLLDSYTNTPVVGDLFVMQFSNDSVLPGSNEELSVLAQKGHEYFLANNIKYAVIFNNHPYNLFKNHLLKENFLQLYPNQKPYYQDDQLTAYKLY